MTDYSNFHIHGFMRRLGLSDREVMVYAFIYSFTIGASGYYWGGQKYMAQSIGLSMRTLQRILRELYRRGLIEKYKRAGGKQGIRCTSLNNEKVGQGEAFFRDRENEQYDGRYATESGEVIEWNEDAVAKMKENESDFYSKVKPKHTIIRYGREGLVHITKAQYDALCSLLPRDEVQNYFLRYECMIKENTETGAKAPHSAYKTIAKWINEDMKV